MVRAAQNFVLPKRRFCVGYTCVQVICVSGVYARKYGRFEAKGHSKTTYGQISICEPVHESLGCMDLSPLLRTRSK